MGVSGVCGLRPARGWSFLFPWPARCGFGRLVENGPALADNSGHREALGPLTGVSFVDSCFFDRTERDWQQWMETGLDALTGAVVALRKKGKEEPPRDPKDAARLTPKSSPHGADDTSPRCTRQTRSNAEMAANDTWPAMRSGYTEEVGRRSDGDSPSPRPITRRTHPGWTTHAISRIGLPVETFGGEKRKRGKASQVVRM